MFDDPPPINPLPIQNIDSPLASADQIPTSAGARARGHPGGRDSGDHTRRREGLRLLAETVDFQTVVLILLEGWDGDESEI